MTIREQLGLPKGVKIKTHPVYAAITIARTKKQTTMSTVAFIDKYFSSWEPGKMFSWKFMKWINRAQGDMDITKVHINGYRYYGFTIPKTSPRKIIRSKNKDELIEIRNNYIIDNGLLGEFTLL